MIYALINLLHYASSAGLYAGFTTSIGGVVLFKSLFLGGYEIIKEVSECIYKTVMYCLLTSTISTINYCKYKYYY